ncbi:hypothetical protein YC2023_042145 [Brassica napus]
MILKRGYWELNLYRVREISQGNMKNLSELPDDLLMKILSLLPTTEAAATSVLSKQWRCLWKQKDVNFVELCNECSAHWKSCISTQSLEFPHKRPSWSNYCNPKCSVLCL